MASSLPSTAAARLRPCRECGNKAVRGGDSSQFSGDEMARPRTIDIHTHILTLETAGLLSKAGAKVTITPDDAELSTLDVNGVVYKAFPTGGYDIPRRLKDMDAAGIDVHLLSATPQTYLYNLDPDVSANLAAIQNDQMAKHVAAHPDRFMAIATLPLAQPARAADELKRVMTKHGFKGAMFASNVKGTNLDDPMFEPLWAEAEKLGAFMFVHPNNIAGADRLKSYYLANLIGNPLDTTIAAASLFFGGVMDRYPKLKVMLAHGGGFTPYQAPRWEHGWKVRAEAKVHIKTQPKNIAGRFLYDTILHSDKTLEAMIGLVGIDKVMLGSDYPYDMAMLDCVKHVRALRISDEDKAAILYGNFERFLARMPK
jgi:aminocarboxymuconate-semialdehyde decarboxylase